MMLLVLLMLLGPQTSLTYPGVKIVTSSKGLDYVTSVVTDWVQKKLQTLDIPEVSGSVNIGIGTVHYALNDISVVKVDLPQPSVTFEENTGLRMELSGLSIAVRGNWRTSFGIIHDGGTFDLALFDVTVSTLVQLGSDYQARFSVECLSCKAQIVNMDMNFYGGASFFLQAFVDIFPGKIRKMIEEQICPVVEEEVKNFETVLAAIKVDYPVGQDLTFSVPLTNAPVVQSTGMEMDLKGVFYSDNHHLDPPFPSEDFQLPWKAGYMMSLGISQFCLNTYAYACLTAGLFQTNITDKMLPPASPVRLNTTSFGQFIPQLPKLFPNMLMLLQVFSEEAPAVTLHMDYFSLLLTAVVNAYAMNSSTLYPLFTLNATVQFSGKVMIANEKLTGKMTFENMTLTLASTKIGTFQTTPLEKFSSFALKSVVLPMLNKKLQNGFPLPMVKGVSLTGPVLQLQQGFVAVFSDVQINYPLRAEEEL